MAHKATLNKRSDHVSLGLNPDLFAGIDGHEKFGHRAQPATDAFRKIFDGFTKVHQLRKNYEGIETLTDAQKTLKVSDLGHKKYHDAVPSLFTVRGGLEDQIKEINKTLSKQVANPSTMVSGEIRNHFKNLPESDRRKELMAAINSGDVTTAQAVLGAPSYLSGLSNEDQNLYTRSYHEKNQPELCSELKFIENVLSHVERASGFINDEYEKTIGADLDYVKKIREDGQRATLAEAAAQ